jgi:hypothetical protein
MYAKRRDAPPAAFACIPLLLLLSVRASPRLGETSFEIGTVSKVFYFKAPSVEAKNTWLFSVQARIPFFSVSVVLINSGCVGAYHGPDASSRRARTAISSIEAHEVWTFYWMIACLFGQVVERSGRDESH